jgi:hypothetical protein
MTVLGPVTIRLRGQLAVRPVDGETVVARVTVPVKPPNGVIVIVEVPVAPVLKSAGEEAEIEKSTSVKVNVAVAGWEDVPGVPAPLMFTINMPALGEVQERLDAPVPLAASDTGVTVNA